MIEKIRGFVNRTYEDNIAAHSASAAYFLILSFIPFLLFFFFLIRYTPVTYNQMRELLVNVLPDNVQGFVLEIVADVYRRNSALVPISALGTMWSAGKGLQSLVNGFNNIYRVKETRNWFVNRIKSVFWTALLGVTLILALLLMLLKDQLLELVSGRDDMIGSIRTQIFEAGNLAVPAILFLVFLLLYRFLPNRKSKISQHVPGAVFTTVSWMFFSNLFSLYFEIFPGFSSMYGSLAALIIVMLWIYFLMTLLLYGAELNAMYVPLRERKKRKAAAETEEDSEADPQKNLDKNTDDSL